ncbi:uncharacterized protein At1g27050 [Prosopis cineraria]|uniref:uncharacterized protein At1g27050 n=1 Tax=Prosopis cineraria TaxID=364024 RepID=UPI0024103070|nr:uncharacterized protein At1g27050 [Prosopis cineraria]
MPKRRRPLPDPALDPTADDAANKHATRPAPPCAVVVMGLPLDCSVLDLKSRFEIYGPISRIRIDRDGVGYITYRSKESADSAIAAAVDPSFGITVSSKRVQVLWATDPLALWREGVGNSNKEKGSMSKLVRAEIPLSRHGRSNKLASAIVNPKNSESGSSRDVPFPAREIVAYDDIL